MKSLIIILVLLLLCGCAERRNGPELREEGLVQETCYVPAGHGRGTGLGYNFVGKGGMTMVSTRINIPERYAVVFKCQHGAFAIDGDRGKALYAKLKKGDPVTIRYCEELVVDGSVTNVADLHFIDADVKKEQP